MSDRYNSAVLVPENLLKEGLERRKEELKNRIVESQLQLDNFFEQSTEGVDSARLERKRANINVPIRQYDTDLRELQELLQSYEDFNQHIEAKKAYDVYAKKVNKFRKNFLTQQRSCQQVPAHWGYLPQPKQAATQVTKASTFQQKNPL